MPLTAEQKQRLKEQMAPLVQEALEEGLTPIVEREVGRVLSESRDEDRRYTNMILSGADQRRLAAQSDQGFGVARMARCMAMAHNDHERAAKIAKELYDDDLGSIVVKALSSGDVDEGGVFVPSNLSDSFIDALSARAIVRQAGPVVVDLSGGNLTVPKVTSDPTAGWRGEGKRRRASNMGTGNLSFTAKHLQGKSSVTNQLLRRSAQNAEQIIRNGLVRVMSNEEDKAFLAGKGTEASPKGMLNWAADANKFDANATINLTNVQGELQTAMSKLTDNNIDLDMAAWFMSWRSRNFLAFQLRDQEDTPVFKGELTANPPTLNGQSEYHGNNIPNNLGSGSDESRIFLAAMNFMWIAEEQGLRVRASTEASFEDESGNTISAFDHDLMVIIIERDVDFVAAHPEAISVIEAVKYGT